MNFVRCTRCVMPSTRPDLFMREDGVCSACVSTERRKSIDWEERHAALMDILRAHDNECIVPSSGGKDSTYQVLRLKELGARPIAVTATTCDLSDIGRRNINNLARYADTIEVTPNRTVRRKLNRIALNLLGDSSWPEHTSIHRMPFKVAKQLGIGLIFYGECPNEAYGGPPGTDETREMTQRWAAEFGGFLGMRASDFVGMDDITEEDMRPYTAPTDAELQSANITAYFLGQFEEWDSRRNARVAMAHGFQCKLPTQANWWDFENVDNMQTGLRDFLMFCKYGFGRLASQVSVDIRSGFITREEGMNLVEMRDGLFPMTYLGVPLATTLAKIGVSSDQFLEVCNRFLNRDIFIGDVSWGSRLMPPAVL